MKISFVIPAYNEEAYLPICLEAVLREKKRGKHDMEIIVVNNASTDSTRAVALSFPDVKVVDQPKKGLAFARQAGFENSTGDLIANIDSDSVLTPEWLDTAVEHFSNNPKLVALSGPFVYHDFTHFSNMLVRIKYNVDSIFRFFTQLFLKHGAILQGGNFIVRRETLIKTGGFDPAFVFWGEDTNLAKQLSPHGKVHFTFKLPIYSSGRRLKGEGYVTAGLKYIVNYFWTIFFNRPYSKSYIDIRKSQKDQKQFQSTMASFNRVLFYFRLGFIFIIFTLLGGSAYVYDRVAWTVVPMTATASTVLIEDHPILAKVHSSIAKIREKVNALEAEFDSDDK